jgi:hypothetical protein
MTTLKSRTLPPSGMAIRFVLLFSIAVFASGQSAQAQQWTTSSNDIYSANSGNVGIGTTTPSQKLEVNGAISALGGSAGFVGFDRSTSGLSVFYRTGGISRIWDSGFGGDVMSFGSNGKVGIGTTSPSATLSVIGTLGLSESGAGCCRMTLAASGSGAVLNHNDNSPIYFQTEGNTWLTILNSGNVGIGTTSPTNKLHVNGDVTIEGNIGAKYQDLAEWVPAASSIPPATVVILDPLGRNTVIPSTESYDTRVAGVVSATPGILLGEAGHDKVKVATTGRVKVRVDATRAPIHTGDLLVTSEREGVAMRSEPIDIGGRKIHQPGTLIGKALEPLNDGEGEILVLLSLQ